MKSETKIIYKRVFYKTLKRLAKISREFLVKLMRDFLERIGCLFYKAFSIH